MPPWAPGGWTDGGTASQPARGEPPPMPQREWLSWPREAFWPRAACRPPRRLREWLGHPTWLPPGRRLQPVAAGTTLTCRG